MLTALHRTYEAQCHTLLNRFRQACSMATFGLADLQGRVCNLQRRQSHSVASTSCLLVPARHRLVGGRAWICDRDQTHQLASSSSQRCGGSGRSRTGLQTQAILGGLSRVFNTDQTEKVRKKYQPQVDQINRLEPQMQALTDEQLQAKTQEFQQRAQQQAEPLDSLLVEAFAVSKGGQAPAFSPG